MVASKSPHRSPLALAVLALLVEAAMHPYQMQRLVKERGKDQVINVGQRASLYKTIDRLRRDGLIAVRETSREAQRPERTVYEATAIGRDTARRWVREMLAAPRREFPEFPAAIAYLPLLDPDDALTHLELRRTRLADELAGIEAQLASASATVPRLFLLEGDYARAVTAAALEWTTVLVDDLRAGRLGWTPEWLAEIAAASRRPDRHDKRTVARTTR
jgi:DNA-binding PadR family transcriptional regulator